MQVDHHLDITAGFKDQKTFLKNCFCKQPFRLANITENKAGKDLQLMIMSSSPGILNNDHYIIKVSVEENASLQLTTQGYQRLFTMHGKASQLMNIYIDNNASLIYMPHPVTPHAASDFSSVNNIFLQKNHSLLWSEIITCGRKLSGEQFMFTRFQNVTNIFLNKKLVVKENVLLEPLKTNVQAMGQLEGYTHQSTLLFINNRMVMDKIKDEVLQYLSTTSGVSFGASLLPVTGLIIRMLGFKGEQLFNYNKVLAGIIQQVVADLY